MIRTVLGDIEKSIYGNALMHEHIQCVSNDMLHAFGNKWLDEEKVQSNAISVLSRLRTRNNLGLFVDGTSIDLGRNIKLLKNISEASGVHIIASTGLYYYPSMVTCSRSAEDLAYWFLKECENGIENTDIKPGILKCAADCLGMTQDTEKRLKALSIVQSQTGLPMYAHCSHTDEIVWEMIEVFAQNKVNPEKTIIGHVSRRLETAYLEKILKCGYYICLDQNFYNEEADIAKTVYKLCEKGYERKILFSHDYPIYNDFASPTDLGIDYSIEMHADRYSYLFDKLIPALKKYGFTDEQCKRFLQNNSIDVLDCV